MTKIAFACAVVLALWGAIEHYSFESARLAQARDPYRVSVQLKRLEGVVAAVPRDAVVGYVSDLAPGSVAWSASFNTAAYALAPRRLVLSADQQWVLGNFSSPQDYAAVGRQHGLRSFQDFGNGAVLFRRSER